MTSFFILCPNYTLSYFESHDAFKNGADPKGCIDLTSAKKILIYDKMSNPYSLGIKCPNRVWKLQLNKESERDKWVKALRDLLKNPLYSGYVMILDEVDANIQDDTNKLKVVITEMNENIQSDFKELFDSRRQHMIKWKEKIQELSEQIAEIERQRQEDDMRNEEKASALKQELNALKSVNDAQRTNIEEKEQALLQNQDEIEGMNARINELEIEEKKAAEYQMCSIHDVLMKVQGDSLSKLKYKKKSKQNVVFISGMNQIFYYDSNQQKHMIVKEVSINNNTIQRQMHYPWFLVIGQTKSALFSVNDESIRNKWVNFIKESLEKHKLNAL